MVELKKKNIVLLIAGLLVAGVLVICSAQSASDGTKPEKSQPDSDLTEAKTESKKSPFFANDPNFFSESGFNSDGAGFSIRAVLAVLFVLALFIGAIYVSKKLLPRIANLPGKEIRIVETVHLGPRKAVHLLEVDNRRFLIGSTNENITKLADLAGEITDLSASQANYN